MSIPNTQVTPISPFYSNSSQSTVAARAFSRNIRILLHAGLVRIRNAPELPLSLPLLAVTVLRIHSVFMDPNFRLVRRYNKTRRFTHVSEDDSPRVGDRQMILGDVRDVREETEQLLGPA